MKRLVAIAIAVVTTTSINAQTTSDLELKDLRYLRDHIGVTLSVSALRPEMTTTYGKTDIQPLWSPGAQIGLSRYMNFCSNWSLETGIKAGVQIIWYNYRYDEKTFNSPYDFDIKGNGSAGTGVIELPALLGRRFRVAERVSLLPQAGLCLRHYMGVTSSSGVGYATNTGTSGEALEVHMEFSPDFDLHVNYQVGAGALFELKNNLLLVKLLLTQPVGSGSSIVRGGYTFYEGTNVAGRGVINSNGGNLALETSYIFTRTKSTRRLLEKLQQQ